MHQHTKLNIVRVIALVMTLLVLSMQWMPAVSAAPSAQKGSCGKDLSWSFFAGTLTITGKGAMYDYSEAKMAPWSEFREDITCVAFPKGMTSVGNLAFYGCKNIKSVILPDSVKTIGKYAFTGCESIIMLDLGEGLLSMGKLAFYGCKSLKNVQLPYMLESIGDQAFYLCESLKTIKIQGNVTGMGHSVFAYCKSLITAEIAAQLNKLPEWTFYGCEQLNIVTLPPTMNDAEANAFTHCDLLTVVYYNGPESSAKNLKDAVVEDIPEFGSYGSVLTGGASGINNSSVIQENDDGTETQHNVTVNAGKNMTVVTELEHTRPQGAAVGGTYNAEISVTIEDKSGWNDATMAVIDSLQTIGQSVNNGASVEKVDVKVYMKEDETPNTTFLQQMAGRDVEVTVISPSGSSWQLDCSIQKKESLTDNYTFAHQLTAPSDKTIKKLKTEKCYHLKFNKTVELNAEVLISLPFVFARSNAFLYQIEADGSYTRLQAVKIDQYAVAHFYLASVNKDTTYIIGINVPGENTEDIIIPDELAADYGGAFIRVERIEYVSTGVKSSWGMSFWQVTFIMIAVLVVVIVVVGAIMTIMNKRRMLKAGVGAAVGTPGTKLKGGKYPSAHVAKAKKSAPKADKPSKTSSKSLATEKRSSKERAQSNKKK